MYTIETNDDSVTLKYGIIMKTDSKYFQLSSFNERKEHFYLLKKIIIKSRWENPQKLTQLKVCLKIL